MNKKLFISLVVAFVFISTIFAYDSADNYKPKNYVPEHRVTDRGPQYYKSNMLEPVSVRINSINYQKFPFIYMNVDVDTNNAGINTLTKNNFEVYEDDVLQSDLFEVTPPDSGDGSRLADFIFVLDVSGSMGEEIDSVRKNMSAFLDALSSSGINYNVGFVVFADPHYIYNDGFLYSEKSEIQDVIDNIELGEPDLGLGGDHPEDQLDAMVSASQMNFRPGAQRVAIMITDATAHTVADVNGKWTSYTVQTCIDELVAKNVSVFPVFDTEVQEQIDQYGPIAGATNSDGIYFDVYDPFNEILENISGAIINTYLVRYYSNNTRDCDYDRVVEVFVNYRLDSDSDIITYTIGAVPMIERTMNTLKLHNQPMPVNTSFDIEVSITDEVAPFTSGATLYYKNSTAATFKTMDMTNISGDLWSATIPTADVTYPGFDYYITATDSQNTSLLPSVEPYKNPFQIAVGANELPDIEHTPLETYAYLNTPISINALVTDNTDNIDDVYLYYRKYGQLVYERVDMNNISGDEYDATIPGNIVTTDGFEYLIRAVDNHNVSEYKGLFDEPILVKCALTPPGHLRVELVDSTDGLVSLKWRKETNNGGFYEDFPDSLLPEWRVVTGDWNVESGTYNTENDDYYRNSVYYNDYFSNFVLEARMRKTEGSYYGVGLYFNGNPDEIDSEGKWMNGYCVNYCTAGNWDLKVYENGFSKNIQKLVCSSEINQGPGEWNRLKVVYAYGYIDVYINHKLQGSYFDETFKRGRVGILLHDDQLGGAAEFDWVELTPLPDQYSFGVLNKPSDQVDIIYDMENNTITKPRNLNLKIAKRTFPIYGLDFQYDANNRAEASDDQPVFKFFKVYRDDYCIAESHKSYYYDNLEVSGTYKYKVTSLYEEGESRPAGPAKIVWGEQNIMGSTFSGKLLYLGTEQPLIGDTLELTGELDNIAITDANGYYQFKGLSGQTIVQPVKFGQIASINGLDLLRLKNHLMGKTALSNDAKKAADCNLDYTINGNDLLILQNFLLGKNVPAPMARWHFTPASYEYPQIVEDMTDKDFSAFIHGDVNLSWTENDALAKDNIAANNEISFDESYYVEDGILYLPISSNEKLDIALVDWQIAYNSADLEYLGINSRFIQPGNVNVNEDGLKITWVYNGKEVKIEEDEVMGELKFKLKTSAQNSLFEFADNCILSAADETVTPVRYTRKNIDLTKRLSDVAVPKRTELFANYPNPFNPTTVIKFALAKDTKVELAVFDLRGRLVETLVNEHKSTGYYTVNWDASKVASGVYIYKLQTSEFTDIKKCIYLK